MWSLLFLLTLSVATVHLAIENQFWHASEVSVERVTSMSSTQLGSLIRCAMLATEISWSHLFVFKDGVCSLSDMRVGKYLNDSDLGPTIACHTRHMYVCRTNGYTYADGESLEDTCGYYFCDRGTVGNIMKATTCPSPFTEDAGLGCVYLNKVSMTFCDARKWWEARG
ncbi:uncharacterized protein LOC121858747 [Homarus americanus]|uniref:Secreted protein n=1 Tax=Homarus americanus TaxID=6706 RepID=A0A8J5TLW0_HOMAM|nr:uncharacterized protein LOC121858747 [Homarus americanus]KAG7174977.1 hypothetical protein Hamer_G015184 [Homarus americanus]